MKQNERAKERELWEVWRDGEVWMVQGPKGRVHFNSKKTAFDVAAANKALALAEVRTLPRICTDVRCTLPGGHPGVCEAQDPLQALYDEVKDAQTAFWLALRRLEVAIGFDIDADADLELTSIDDLREQNEKECASR